MQLFSLTFLFVTVDDCVLANGIVVSRDRAVEIAKQQIAHSGLDVNEYSIEVDEDNKDWNEWLSMLGKSRDESNRRLRQQYDAKLSGKSYWIINFVTKAKPGIVIKDGTTAVFVDRNTGEILMTLRGGME
jgi:hypothetical protein